MDTSKEYIKMCEEAKEMQTIQEYTISNLVKIDNHILVVTHDDGESLWGVCFETRNIIAVCKKKNHIVYIFCQSQLQETVKPASGYTWDYIRILWDWIQNKAKYIKQFTSMEQLWLAFVMKEKYNKVWNGKTWEVQK